MKFEPGDRVVRKYGFPPNPEQGTVLARCELDRKTSPDWHRVSWDNYPNNSCSCHKDDLRKVEEVALPKPGTLFRVKAGCAAAYKAGDMTAVQNGEGALLSYVRTETDPTHAGQWRMAGNLGFGEFECVIGPNWLEPIEDVPSPPVAGKGVHAQPPHVAEAGKETTKQGDHTMANPIKIETQLLIDGSPLKEFSDDSLFSIISEQEAAIKKYEAIANRPKALEAKIAAIQAGIAALVEAIDTRGPGDKPEA